MFYRVTAKLKSETAREYLRRLTDGTIQSQPPDGAEIVSAMSNAVMTDDGEVLFSIGCFCSVPLAHERATVFDHFFEDMDIQRIEARQTLEGASFMTHLSALAASQGQTPTNQPEPL